MTENEAIIRCEKLINGLSVACATSDAFKDENKGYTTFETMRIFAETCKNALSEIQQYRAIGTVEEFKALKEKAEPKKIEYQIGKNGLKHEKCPTCGSFSVFGRYCSECGQNLD